MARFGTFANLSQSSGESRLNWGHPLAPRSRNGLYLPFNTPGRIQDLVRDRLFTKANAVVETNWVPSRFPYGHNHLGFQMSSGPTYYTASGAANPDSSSNNYMMMACVYFGTSATGDGNRVISNGNDNSMILEPCRSGTTFFVLSGGIAHVNTTLSSPLNQWQFSAACVRSGSLSNYVVYNYQTGRAQATTGTFTTLTNTGGTYVLGTNNNNASQSAPGIVCFAMIDYAYWSIDDMLRLAQDPWAALDKSSSKSTFVMAQGLGTTHEGQANLSVTASLSASSTNFVRATSSLSSVSSLAAVSLNMVPGASIRPGVSTLTASATNIVPGKASFACASSLIASGLSYVTAVASLSGVASVTPRAICTYRARGSLSVLSTPSLRATVRHNAIAQGLVQSSLSSVGKIWCFATAGLTKNQGVWNHWRLNEGTGTTSVGDTGPYGSVASMTGFIGNPWSTDVPSIQPNNLYSLAFDGSQYLQIFPNWSYPFTTLTMSFWMKCNATSQGIFTVVSTGVPGGNPGGWVPVVIVNPSGYLQVSFVWHNTISFMNSVVLVNDNKWHHVMVSYDGTTEYLYIDGVFQNSRTLAQVSFNTTYNYFLGAAFVQSWAGTGWWYYTGLLDDVRFYQRAFAQEEAKALWLGMDPVLVNLISAPRVVSSYTPSGGVLVNGERDFEHYNSRGRFDLMDLGM